MTREEATERLKFIKADCYIISEKEDKEAFDIAIKALEQDRPIGHWIPRKNIAVKSEDIDKVDNLRWRYECSECGYEVREKHDYCVCGAKMVDE